VETGFAGMVSAWEKEGEEGEGGASSVSLGLSPSTRREPTLA